MKMGKNNSAFDRDFNPLKTKSKCYIHINNKEIPVLIIRKGKRRINLRFSYNGKLIESQVITCKGQRDYIGDDLSRIKFRDINLHEIDLINLAKCIDQLFDEDYR